MLAKIGDSILGLPGYDLLGSGLLLIQEDKGLLEKFLNTYGYSERALIKS